MIQHTRLDDNLSASRIILVAGLLSLVSYLWMASLDLAASLPLYLALHGLLTALALVAWRTTARFPSTLGWIVAGAVLFRLVVAFSEPTLSDDLYRYVWDGRVQLHGVHPYAHAPVEPALEALRDDDWARINHPELRTIYPPLAQGLFAGLAGLGAGTLGFKLFLALADLAVLAALGGLLRRARLPLDRLVLYAWNPVAIVETAGSGHIEPVGVALVVAVAAWLCARRMRLAAGALAAAVHVKVLPLVLVPAVVRRGRLPALLILVAVLAALALPYALTGPAVGSGLFDYAQRWERNAVIYSATESLLEWVDTGPRLKPLVSWARDAIGGSDRFWNWAYSKVWPREVARGLVGLAALAWVLRLARRRSLSAPREIFLALAGVLLLSPTMHPWYVLWVLPFAAAYASVPWLLLVALVPLAYIDVGGDVPWGIRAIEYGIPLLAMILLRRAPGDTME